MKAYQPERGRDQVEAGLLVHKRLLGVALPVFSDAHDAWFGGARVMPRKIGPSNPLRIERFRGGWWEKVFHSLFTQIAMHQLP